MRQDSCYEVFTGTSHNNSVPVVRDVHASIDGAVFHNRNPLAGLIDVIELLNRRMIPREVTVPYSLPP